jgi:arsenite-transporting ATPase
VKRIILYTGKGGVGKTSVAAATALRCADLGYHTVVVSTDAAHSLADSFDLPLGPEPTQIGSKLWGQEIDVLHQMDKYWGNIQHYMSTVLSWKGLDDLVAEELSVFPGMEELASLLQIVHLHDDCPYEVVIVDCAPSGATLQLLAMPHTATWYMERMFQIGKRTAKLHTQLHRMHALLTDPQKSSVRLVLNTEKMVIKEAQRTFTYLNLFGYATDAVISNRLIPGRVQDSYFDSWKESQEKYSRMVEEAFLPLPILQVPLFEQEVVGEAMLRRMAEAIYGSIDPTKVYFVGQVQAVEKRDGHHLLSLPLPFVDKDDVELTRSGDELIVHIGNRKRNIILPRALASLDVLSAKYENDRLVMTFGENNATQ